MPPPLHLASRSCDCCALKADHSSASSLWPLVACTPCAQASKAGTAWPCAAGLVLVLVVCSTVTTCLLPSCHLYLPVRWILASPCSGKCRVTPNEGELDKQLLLVQVVIASQAALPAPAAKWLRKAMTVSVQLSATSISPSLQQVRA